MYRCPGVAGHDTCGVAGHDTCGKAGNSIKYPVSKIRGKSFQQVL